MSLYFYVGSYQIYKRKLKLLRSSFSIVITITLWHRNTKYEFMYNLLKIFFNWFALLRIYIQFSFSIASSSQLAQSYYESPRTVYPLYQHPGKIFHRARRWLSKDLIKTHRMWKNFFFSSTFNFTAFSAFAERSVAGALLLPRNLPSANLIALYPATALPSKTSSKFL